MTLPSNTDTDDMHSLVKAFPRLIECDPLEEAVLRECADLRDDGLHGICLLGMGGSSIANQYTVSLLQSRAKTPVLSIHDYGIPEHVDHNYVVIAVSYSGNTEETLAAHREAVRRGSPTFCVTSGGVLSRESRHLLSIPEGLPPRAALPLILAKVLPLTEALCNLQLTDLKTVGSKLEEMAKSWDSQWGPPEDTADDLQGSIPVFMGADHLVPVAYRAKCQTNENAKTEAFFSAIPEANHNEIEGFTSGRAELLCPVILRSGIGREENDRRIKATTEVLESLGYRPLILRAVGDSMIEEMLSLTHYLDAVTLAWADLRGVDPIDVSRITLLKDRMRRA
ncbi:MAG: bifunctional phosphoglucose/phosphomannose isomerase [Candidatus Thorarchaeota archaeon]